MADSSRKHRPEKPIYRRNRTSSPSSSSSSYNTKSYNYRNSSVTNSSVYTRKPAGASNSESGRGADEDNIPTIAGTCPFMCPVDERERRERLRDLAVFERLHGDPSKSSPSLAVKKFCRTISKKEVRASDVRPIQVLEDTLNYLLNLFLHSTYPFEVVHDFIFDRTRSIRQDLGMQNCNDDRAINLYERMVKFHIISHHQLCQSCGTPNVSSIRHLNFEQLTKTLTTLISLYGANRSSQSLCKNESEFYSFYLLLHMGSDNHGESLSLWFRRVPSLVIKSTEFCFARRVLRYYRLGNYRQFMYTVENEASYLQYCILEPYINEVRILALCCVSYGGYKLQPYPLEKLSKLLAMKESDIESLCVDCAFEISNDESAKGLLSIKQAVVNTRPTMSSQKYYPVDSDRIERLCAEQSQP